MPDSTVTAKGKVTTPFFVSYGSVLPQQGQGVRFGDWPVNPDTDAVWTQDEIDSLEVGMESVDIGGGANQVVVDGVYLIVEHDEARSELREEEFGAQAFVRLEEFASFTAKPKVFVPGDSAVGGKVALFSGNRVFPLPPPGLEITDVDIRQEPGIYP